MNIVVYPNAKVNIGLRIIGKREDGFHNLETLFMPVPITDILELAESHELSIRYYGAPFSLPGGDIEKELCIRAYRLLQKDFDIPPVEFHLYKQIPVGAGLGGGSSDAAFTLKALNSLFSLGISEEQLALYASRLGSDCPFFVYDRPMFGEGRGEILTRFDAPWLPQFTETEGDYFIRVTPLPVSVSTAQAYKGVTPDPSGKGLKEILQGTAIEQWKDVVINDFETSVFAQHPEIAAAKQNLYDRGAVFASMSGSGSSVFGVFRRGK